MKNLLRSHGLLIGIIVLAAFFRLWQITQLPGGLFPDEAANGLDVNSILKGQLQPFYERGNGREGLFFYFLAFSVALFGRGPWQHHMVSAGFGIMEVLLAYFLARHMFGKRVALLASFFMAISSYAVTISRTAFRANTVPLFTTLTLLLLVKFFETSDRKQKIVFAALAGLSFGLGFYTYISFRMMVPLIIGFGLLLSIAYRDRIKQLIAEYWRPKLAFFLGFVASFSWIGYYFLSHPGTFVGRAGQVSIFSPELNHGDVWGTFLLVFKKTLLSFFTEGDLNWRHNVSGYPLLSPLLSPFFAVALIFLTFSCFRLLMEIWNKNLTKTTVYRSVTAVWFWFMIIPEVTTAEGIPHGLRLIGVIPVIFILSAWGVDWLWSKIAGVTILAKAKTSFATLFLLTLLVYNFNLYFVVAADSPDYYYAFRSDLTVVSKYLNERNQKSDTYLSLDKFSVQTVDYLTTETDQPYTLLDPAHTYEVSLKKGDQVIFTQSTMFDRLRFLASHPDVQLLMQKINKFGQPIMLVYEQL